MACLEERHWAAPMTFADLAFAVNENRRLAKWPWRCSCAVKKYVCKCAPASLQFLHRSTNFCTDRPIVAQIDRILRVEQTQDYCKAANYKPRQRRRQIGSQICAAFCAKRPWFLALHCT